MTKRILASAFIALLCAAPAQAADPLASLSYLVGTWSCTYNGGGQHTTYTATYDYAWPGGGGDVGLTTYEPKGNTWTEIVAVIERSTTLFRAKGSDGAHRVYRSVYPSTLMTLIFDRISDAKYTLHFNGTYAGKTMTSYDVCTKQ